MATNLSEITFLPCDVFFVRGDSILSKGIRVCTRKIGEARTKVNHVGAFVSEGDIKTALEVEALATVKRNSLYWQYCDTKDEIAVFRPVGLTNEQMGIITSKLNSYVGRTYGYAKIVTHFLDWMLQGAYVFRRLTNMDRYPICSWVVAQSFSAAGLHFGVEPGAATPDDIWDFCVSHPDKYKEIMSLRRIE